MIDPSLCGFELYPKKTVLEWGEAMGGGKGWKSPQEGISFPQSQDHGGCGGRGGVAGVLDRGGTLRDPPGALLSLGGLTPSSPSTLASWIDSGPSTTFGPVSGAAPSLVRPHQPLSPHPSPLLPIPEQTSGGEDKRKAALCLPCPPARAESFLTQKWRVWRGREQRED